MHTISNRCRESKSVTPVVLHMKKITISSAIGIAVVAVGVWWIFDVLLPPLYNATWKEKDTFDYVLLLTILLLMTIPGILMAYFGFRLTKHNSGTNIKGVVGTLSIFGVIWVHSLIRDAFGESKIASGLSMLTATLVIIPIYVAVSKYWMKTLGLNPVRGEFIGKGIVTIIAWQIWFISSDIARGLTPIKEGYTHVPEEPWGLIGLVGPLLIAVIFCKITMRLIEKNVEPEVGGYRENAG